ncbi:MAG: hypothetical protein R8P61_22870 [Bacteroidia bacterium]|nr:hypothetical protein [Bacteroidia bacterium]
MKKLLLISYLSIFSLSLIAQEYKAYEVSAENPFGLLNPDAPKEVADYAPLIGICDCVSESRKQDQTWAEPVQMTWKFKYIMNGQAVQDETVKEDGTYSGSIRQFNADSSKWYVHYYSKASAAARLPAWEGGKVDDKIILYMEQKAPNGMDGSYKISFYDISEEGFKWLGEWVNVGETFSFPTWKISCTKRKAER